MKQRLQTVDVIQFILRSWIFIRTVLFALVYLGGASALSFTSLSWLVFPVLALFIFLLFKYQFQIFPVSQVIEKVYNQYYHDKTLKDLKDRPLMAIASSNLHTGRPFTFSGIKMSDSTYSNPKEYDPPIRFRHEDFPVARAVMASSCVPFAFTPVLIDKVFLRRPRNIIE